MAAKRQIKLPNPFYIMRVTTVCFLGMIVAFYLFFDMIFTLNVYYLPVIYLAIVSLFIHYYLRSRFPHRFQSIPKKPASLLAARMKQVDNKINDLIINRLHRPGFCRRNFHQPFSK